MTKYIQHLQHELVLFGTSGFYKKVQEPNENGSLEDELVYGPNAVMSSNYVLTRENKDSLNLPIDGWYWFESEEEARTILGVPKEDAQTSTL